MCTHTHTRSNHNGKITANVSIWISFAKPFQKSMLNEKKNNFFSTWQKPMTSILSHQAPLCCFNTYTHTYTSSARGQHSLFFQLKFSFCTMQHNILQYFKHYTQPNVERENTTEPKKGSLLLFPCIMCA